MITIKFTVNGVELEADFVIGHFSGEEYLVHCEDIRCGGESLDDEEMTHILLTNPNLPYELAQLALMREGKVPVH